MQKTIVFIHGMFQNPKSWNKWISYFEAKGYKCLAPAWPYHEGEPAELRKNIPQGLGDLRLQTIIDQYETLIKGLPAKPIVIGHSVGGLIVQVLLNKGLIEQGVAISSVAPNDMLTLNIDFLKNAMSIANPLKGDEPYLMTAEGFHASFANTISQEESDRAYADFATHDSRNVFRDCMKKAGHVDLNKPHAPLLFIAGSQDQIVPPELNAKNADAYTDEKSTTEIKEFSGRGHYICGQPDWEEVADYVSDWIEDNVTENPEGRPVTNLRSITNKEEEL